MMTGLFSCISGRSPFGLFVDIIFSWEICVVRRQHASHRTQALFGLFVEMTFRCVEHEFI